MERYGEIFDDEFVRLIVSSDNDKCGRIGWRGLQLHGGLVWFDSDGRIRSINYESELEERERYRLIDLERRELHESLRDYRSPVLEWETCTYRIRVDRVDHGYRYASWKVHRLHDSEPDIVIDNGTYNMEGTIGNHGFYFSSGEYKYILYVDATEIAPAGDLEVYRTSLSGYYDVRYKSEEHEMMLAESVVSSGTANRYQALLKRLRNCSG